MSDLRMDVCPASQFGSLIYSNQRFKEPDSSRDFSPEFLPSRQDTKREHQSDGSKRSKVKVNVLSLNLSSKTDTNQENKPAKQKAPKVVNQEGNTKRKDRSARTNKSELSKPLASNQSCANSSKQNKPKENNCTILTPKYRQINLKRNGLICAADNIKNEVKLRDKSTNYPKKGKLCIELSKINSVNKGRGVSADEVINSSNSNEPQKELDVSKRKKINKNYFKVTKTSREPKLSERVSFIEHNTYKTEEKKDKVAKTSPEISGKDNNYSHRINQSNSLIDPTDKNTNKNRVKTKSVKPIKIAFSKGSDHKIPSIQDYECVDTKIIEDCENTPRLKIDDNQIESICCDAKNNPKTEEFLPDFGCNIEPSSFEGGMIQEDNIKSEKDFDKDQLDIQCKTKRSNSIRAPFEIKLLTNEQPYKPYINILSNSSESRDKSNEK